VGRKEITEWYAKKIGKSPSEFDAIDKHIETVIQTWEKERSQVLLNTSTLEQEFKLEAEKAHKAYEQFAKQVLKNTFSALLEADMPKGSKQVILRHMGHSTDLLD